MLKLILFYFLFLISAHSQVIPENEISSDYDFDISSFYKINDTHQAYFNTNFIFQDKQSNRKDIQFHYRYRWHRNWLAGVIIKRSYGLRHNEDWTNSTGTWKWTDTSSRGENLSGFLVQHKQVLWGKGKGILKNRLSLIRNWFNDQDTVFFKTGVLNFGWRNWTTIHQFEFGIPLNYNRSFFNEIWHYSAFMYRYNDFIKFGPKLTLGKMFWNESIDFNSRKGNEFTQDLLIYRLGFGVIFSL